MKGLISRIKQKKVPVLFFVIGGTVLVVLIMLIVAAFLLQSPVRHELVLEAGHPFPKISEFLKNPNANASFITNIENVDTKVVEPSGHRIRINANGKEYTSNLKIIDTVAPSAEPERFYALLGERIDDPFPLVRNIEDASEVTARFALQPNPYNAGTQILGVILTDGSKNSTSVLTSMYVLDYSPEVKVYAGSSLSTIDPKSFITNYPADDPNAPEVKFDDSIANVDFARLGQYKVGLVVGGQTAETVIDVIPPEKPIFGVANVSVLFGVDTELTPNAFIRDLIASDKAAVSFVTEPDYSIVGTQKIIVRVTDEKGEYTEGTAALEIIVDKEPPTILGELDKAVKINTPDVDFLEGVAATDNHDDNVEVTVDASRVNMKKVGTYNVTYSAADTSGNKTTARGKIRVER
ncbi:hypothetical protein FACS1894188_01040 [Clostridia bacterium]|nr:hypothetical protein FACS1894188_01040 [Clostridia bacterium]